MGRGSAHKVRHLRHAEKWNDPVNLRSENYFQDVDVMSTNGNGGLPILSCWDTEMVSHPEHGDHGVFFSSTFFSLVPERLDAARAFGSLAFFMRTKARRDRVMYPRRSTRFARVYLYLYTFACSPVYLLTKVPVYLFASLPVYQFTCLPIYGLTWLPITLMVAR